MWRPGLGLGTSISRYETDFPTRFKSKLWGPKYQDNWLWTLCPPSVGPPHGEELYLSSFLYSVFTHDYKPPHDLYGWFKKVCGTSSASPIYVYIFVSSDKNADSIGV